MAESSARVHSQSPKSLPGLALLRRRLLGRSVGVALIGLVALPPVNALAAPPTLLDLEAGEKPATEAVDTPAATTGTEAPAGGSLLDEMEAGEKGGPAWDVPPAPPAKSYPYVEYHGYFRFRPDVLSNGHLGMAVPSTDPGKVVTTSAVQPPLSRWPSNNDDSNPFTKEVGDEREESALLGANMRLRLAPTLHVAESIRISTTLDILDNYVLGGDPDYAGPSKRPDVPLVAFATSTRPGAIAVKEAYGEWKTLLGLLRIGRQASAWGLGIFANGGGGDGWDHGRPVEYYGGPRLPHEGSGYDADFGSYVDRAAFLTKIPKLDVYFTLFYDYVSAGILSTDPNRVDGQVYDLEQDDDVSQYGFAILSKPLSAQEIDGRKSLLLDQGKGAFDWGLYGIYRSQALDLQSGDETPASITIDQAKEVQLMVRDAWAAAGDVWFRYEKRISFLKRFVAEAEFALLYGKIEDANALAGGAAKDREILMWGGALKAAYQSEALGFYLDAGVASGDNTRCFGVYATAGDANCTLSTADGAENDKITAFKFHKNYRVDSILYREVVGAVTNSIYVKPTVSVNAYPFYAAEQLGVDLSVLYARAVDEDGTPGGGANLGTEFEVRGFLGQKGLFLGSVSFAYLLPGDALDLEKGWFKASDSATAENAWRLLTHLALMF